MARLPDLPVFPLPLVLLPGELLPLHIFEARYRELVARCLAGPEPFCVVLEDDDGVREVGCLARDLTVLERLADGRLNVVVSGGEPVRLGPIDDEAHSYLSAEATVLEDDEEPVAVDEIEAALAAYRALLTRSGARMPSRSRPSRASPTRSARASTWACRSGRRCSSRARRPRASCSSPRRSSRGATACASPPSASAAQSATARSIRAPENRSRAGALASLVGVPDVGYCCGGRTCGRQLGQPAPQARKPTIAGRGSSRKRLEG